MSQHPSQGNNNNYMPNNGGPYGNSHPLCPVNQVPAGSPYININSNLPQQLGGTQNANANCGPNNCGCCPGGVCPLSARPPRRPQ